MPKVYNKRRKGVPPDAVYVGRGLGSKWGNPYPVGIAAAEYTRKEALQLYQEYAERRLKRDPHWLDELKGKDLVCWCSPFACHADILLKLANSEFTSTTD